MHSNTQHLLTVLLTVSKASIIADWKEGDLCYEVTKYLLNLLPAISHEIFVKPVACNNLEG